ncbi:SulP family inorganic anion transporter [Candidatus Dependentiae bacterium]|nr:SulP family inorganic anion transporter [Candidatus Dependentiae bacterium]
MIKSELNQIRANLLSGITVGLVSVPICISLAVASGATPVMGIITAIWAGFVASLAGGSDFNITGPTGALAGLLSAYSIHFGIDCLPMLAILSGIIIYGCYQLHLERYLMFIPSSALYGFILGIAGMIIINQLESALGLMGPIKAPNLVAKAFTIFHLLPSTHLPALSLFAAFFAGLMFFAFKFPRLPGSIVLAPVGILIGYCCSTGLLPWSLQTLSSKYGTIDVTVFQVPVFQFRFAYLMPAFCIAVISILETLVSARIADGMTKTKHDKRQEMLGLSLSNIITGFAGGMPATAALARTALNIRSGCSSKFSGAIASICIGLISCLVLPYFAFLPLPVIAAILMFVSFRMLQMEHFTHLYKHDKKHFALALVVAFVTIYDDPVVGILLGAVMAMLILMEKFSQGDHEIMVQSLREQSSNDTMVYSIKGPLAYINARAHRKHLDNIPPSITNVVIDIHGMHFIDADGAEALVEIIQSLQMKNITTVLVDPSPRIVHFLEDSQTYKAMQKHGFICATLNDAYFRVYRNAPEKITTI